MNAPETLTIIRDAMQDSGPGGAPLAPGRNTGKDYQQDFGIVDLLDWQEIAPDVRREAVVIAGSVQETVPQLPPLDVEGMVADETRMMHEGWHVRRNLLRLASVYGVAVKDGILSRNDTDPLALGKYFSAEYLVSSAILDWPTANSRVKDPAFHLSAAELAGLKADHPNLVGGLFREAVFGFKGDKRRLSILLGNIAASGISYSVYSRLTKAELQRRFDSF